jgi:two-component system chemotaxis response regulator CheY
MWPEKSAAFLRMAFLRKKVRSGRTRMMLTESPSILITDNDQRFRSTVSEVLRPAGYRTIEATNGVEAVEIVRREQVHVLLLDMHMPQQDGLQTLRLVKQFKALLPCILLSAKMDESLEQEARKARAFEVLRKPVSRVDLTGVIKQALNSAYGVR